MDVKGRGSGQCFRHENKGEDEQEPGEEQKLPHDCAGLRKVTNSPELLHF
jgi:hypothetical protein